MPRTTATAVFGSNTQSSGELFWSTLVVFRTAGLSVKANTKVSCTLTQGGTAKVQQLAGTVQPFRTGVNPADVSGLTFVLLIQPCVFEVNTTTFTGTTPRILTDQVSAYLDGLRPAPGGAASGAGEPAAAHPADGEGDFGGGKHWWCYICPGPDC